MIWYFFRRGSRNLLAAAALSVSERAIPIRYIIRIVLLSFTSKQQQLVSGYLSLQTIFFRKYINNINIKNCK